MKLWLRVFVPPFILTCESPLIAAPTATRQSLLRLIAEPDKSNGDAEVLVFPKPQAHGRGTVRIRPSPLKDAIGKVRDFADEAKHEGENWARMGDVAKAMHAIDTSQFCPAETYTDYVIAEAGKWSGSQGGRIKISSLDTYTSNISSALAQLRYDDNMREWHEEWYDFFAFLRATAPGDTPEQKKAAGVTRTTAATRFVRTLAEIGYPIPQALLDEPVVRGLDGMRRSAASTLLLQSDRDRVTRIMAGHFAEDPLWGRLAPLYCALRWHFAFRSIEAAVLPLDAIDEFMCLVVTTDGFAHLKSTQARRLAPVDQSLVDQFRSAAMLVARARPGASWMFLLDDRSDWSFIEELEDAFGAALKQVTGEREARQHAARAVLPLNVLFPGWEPLLRRFLNGQASTDDCVRFCTALSQQGFGAMVAVLLRTGHGHPLTYLRHYFALWDLLFAIFAQASLATIPADPARTARAYGATASASLRQTMLRSRDADVAMDAWAWMTGYVPARSCLPSVEREEPARQSSSVRRRAPSTSHVVTPLARQMLYLALRMTMKDEDQAAAAHGAQVPTSVAAHLETIYVTNPIGGVRQRHQMPDSERGRDNEVKYLMSEDGLILSRSLAESSPATVQQLALALTPMRAGDYVLPSLEAFRSTVVRLAACLPASLGLLTQFRVGRLQSADRALLTDARVRIFVGADDRDLRERPRLSVVPADDPLNFVWRARRTANTRALLAALQLIRGNYRNHTK